MPSDFELFGKQHPFLPAGWGPQARSDIPWNAPQLPDVNPGALIVSRLTGRFGDDGRGRAAGDGADGGMGDNGRDGLSGVGAANSGGGVGLSGTNRSNSAQLASITQLLAANGISYSAIAAGTSIFQRLANASGEGICNEDGTITITLTI